MELKLFMVMTLISVYVCAQIKAESSTMVAELDTPQRETTSISENQTVSNTTEHQTTEVTFNYDGNTSSTPKEVTPVFTIKPSAVESTTVKSTPSYVESTTKQSTETFPEVTPSVNVETTTFKSNEIESDTKTSTESTPFNKAETSTTTIVEKYVSTISSTQETTTTISNGASSTVKYDEMVTTTTDIKEHGSTNTEPSVEKITTDLSPEEFFKWLDSIEPNNHTDANVTDKEDVSNKNDTNAIITNNMNSVHDHHHHDHAIDPERMPPKEFFEWLDSIHPDSNRTTVKNIIDTSIISTEKLIIVISTICGTFVLFVAILIAISCCRRKRNLRNDSEKSDFSMNSVISIPEKRNSRNSDIFSPDKNGFNNVFMGIPANNEVWKKLEQLSPTASAVMPESTKM